MLLQDLMVGHQFKPDHIFNVDEKTISTVHNHPPKESSRPRNGQSILEFLRWNLLHFMMLPEW